MPRRHVEDASRYLPKTKSLTALRKAVQKCRACDLYKNATQAVFGAGSASARIVFVGEQPGNEEDRQGLPFVGPAGKLLDRALVEAGIDRSEVYLTNVVKHFKFEERGKRRIHKKPNSAEINACRPWLEAEISVIKPTMIVCLGATAAQALLGRTYRLTKERGKFTRNERAPYVTATIHPSAILRAPDEEQRHQQYKELVDDLKQIKSQLQRAAENNE
jgi:DNA polymerase